MARRVVLRRMEAALLLTCAWLPGFGCGRTARPGSASVPADVHNVPGVYTDVNPRWSHDGTRIAYLRETPDRRMQLFLADGDLQRTQALLEPELLNPDRPYGSAHRRYTDPDTLAWSPDDRQIAFSRIDWFLFEDGERLPGTGLWVLDIYSGRVRPLALHPARYRSLFYYYHTPGWSPDGRYLTLVGESLYGERVVFFRPLAALRAYEVVPRFDAYTDSDWPVWRPQVGTDPVRSASSRGFAAAAARGATGQVFACRQRIQRAPGIPPTETIRLVRPGNPGAAGGGEIWRITARTLAASVPAGVAAGAPVVPRLGHLAWSPDGERLAFSLTPDANDWRRYSVWILNADERQARPLLPRRPGLFAPVWIDSMRIGALAPHGEGFEVVVADLRTGASRTIAEIPTSDCDWSPDRSKIVYAIPRTDRRSGATTLRILRILATHATAGAG